ncbi:dihydrolipoamide acetyltransferase family protein [Peterkaempfera bronchialis]|uniref:Dihydrolipoamide acetyltransferase component of pyruvate dehydrogenase complex n=1 Tax=Peterkaempfera bronchialis TaxID=2126346 RepID=A0A345T5K0_9ACTN|nr:dihydrolipoamide acetyltransferase family protein [Peterkaempfera bronchialis]AXI81255.1 2-oxo acid dehydrogenase subunit E2 [Peterkaempfera bronchialis]
MPDVGEGLVEARILTWHVAPGDTVTDGQPVCEVETAKAAVELPIPYDGVVAEILHPADAVVAVGTPIISVAPAGAAAPAPAPVRQEVLVGYGPRTDGAALPRRHRTAQPVAAPPARAAETAEEPRPRAKPPVRKLAKDLGVDLSRIRGSGADASITREDVLAASSALREAAAVRPGERRVPVQGVRKATAQAMVASAFTAPHVTEFLEVDVTRTMKLVRRLKKTGSPGDIPVSPLLMVAAAYLTALRRHPEANASWDEPNQEIVLKEQVNLGIAVATARGLVVPNIKDAGRLTPAGLAGALRTLVATARAGRSTPADLRGGTATITNIGVLGVDTGTPLLNPGEATILAFGAVRPKPWVHKGALAVRDITTLALSFDHRLVDGELGAKVLADTAAVLEHPQRLMMGR